MKINAVFECNSANSSPADANQDTVRFYQKCQLKLACLLTTWQFREGLKETENENIWWQWRK